MASSMALMSPPLNRWFDQRDVILVTGKGGTGKSTLVAAPGRPGGTPPRAAVAVEFSAYTAPA